MARPPTSSWPSEFVNCVDLTPFHALEAFDAGAIKSQAIEEGMITLQQDANHKVLAGITSVDEAFRVTH